MENRTMNTRRSFLKSLAGALVASAIEIRLIAEPLKVGPMPTGTNTVYDPMKYRGDFRWINTQLP